ncbi:MAG: hypothetical protein K0B10_15850 [Vicingaceae bacterium]|nr:hypothetical protein [Vicingaceae bacterium]
MNTIVITPKSKASFDLLVSLAKLLGEKMNIVDNKILSDSLFAAQIEEGIKGGMLSEKEKSAFLNKLKSGTEKK